MAKTFFIADTHFDHERIIGFENRPFKDVKEMNSAMISNWNQVVSRDDKVFMLGDFAFAGKEKIQSLVHALNGRKILIIGNHDRSHSLSWWKTSGFEEVIDYPIIYKEWYMLSHEPMYINKNMPYANIFGHVHANPEYMDYTEQSFCVSVERIGYTPIEWNAMVEKMRAANKD